MTPEQPPLTKPGWQTSEFWVTLASQLLTVATLLGFVSMIDAQRLQGAIAAGVAGAFAFIANAAVVWSYIRGRVESKNTVILQHVSEIQLQTEVARFSHRS